MTFPGSRPPGWRLKPIGKYGLPTSIDIGRAGLTIGREPANSCPITGERWTMVSATHARLEFEGSRLVVHDLGSTNGTFLNDVRIDGAELGSGDVLQLGKDGPRFLVFHALGLEATVVEDDAPPAARVPASLGETAMISLKRALGLEQAQANATRLEQNQKRQVLAAAMTLCVLALAGVVGFSRLRRAGEDGVARLERSQEARVAALERESTRRVAEVERQNEELAEQNRELSERIESGLARVGGELEQRIADSYVAREAWDAQRIGLEAQRVQIEARLTELRASRDGSAEELGQLSRRLEETIANLEPFNPREIEAEKLAEVLHVRSAVVMIESRVVFREPLSQKLLHMDEDALEGSQVNLRDEGSVLEQRSSGSGFVVSPDGLILTNAHVASPADFRDPISITDDDAVLPEVELSVVFSGSSTRYPASLVRLDAEDENDFALIRIEPFAGMPSLRIPDLDAPPPEPGTEVYLCGFPLGTFAIQEGDRVIASTLKGILSRNVGPYVQIDAGVHPGISGGPVTDSHGKVIGVVCSVQATPGGEIAATIGYALPIGAARRVLPAELFH